MVKKQMSPPSVEAAYRLGVSGGKHNEGERLAFEAWMRGHCWGLAATWSGTQYVGDHEVDGRFCPFAAQTRALWAAWRDRAALCAEVEPVNLGFPETNP